MLSNNFIEIVKEMVKQEMEEVTTTASVDGYQTPFAFSGKRKKDKDKKDDIIDASGYEKVDEEIKLNKENNTMKITKNHLRDIVKEVVKEESEYQTFFKKALEKTGKSIPSMSDEEKKEFFNKIDAAWKAKGEKNEGNAFGAAVTKAKEQGDASFEVGGKTYKVESVNENKINIDKKVTNIINTSDFKKFVRYINSFYGKKGVYSSGKDVKEKDIMKALYNVFKRNNSYEWGDGDSVDREFVRDELMKMGILSDKMYEQEVNEEIKVGSSVTVNNPTLKKPIKGKVKHILKSPKGLVYVLNDPNGVWDAKWVSTNESVNETQSSMFDSITVSGSTSNSDAYKEFLRNYARNIRGLSDNKVRKMSLADLDHKFGSEVISKYNLKGRRFDIRVRELMNKGLIKVEESVNEARTVSKPIKVDDDTMVQIVGDNKGFRELTAALNPKTGKPIQKFGYERGNEIADSKEELIKKLQKKYGKSIKFESVNEGDFNNSIKRKLQNPDKQFKSAIEFIKALSSAGVDKSAISTNDWDGSPSTNVYITIPYGSKRNGGKTKVFKNKFGNRALKNALEFWKSAESVNEASLKKFDDVHIKSKNLSGMVYKISGNTVVVRTIDGLVKAKKDDVTKIHSDNVNEDFGTIALGVMGGIGLYKILKFALKKVGVAVGSRVSLPKESLHKVVEQTQQALIKNFIKGDKSLNMMEIAALSKLLKDYIDEGKIKNAKDIQTYSKHTIEAIIKNRK